MFSAGISWNLTASLSLCAARIIIGRCGPIPYCKSIAARPYGELTEKYYRWRGEFVTIVRAKMKRAKGVRIFFFFIQLALRIDASSRLLFYAITRCTSASVFECVQQFYLFAFGVTTINSRVQT